MTAAAASTSARPNPGTLTPSIARARIRRQFPGWRGHYYGFKYSTQDNVEELRKWLEANCEGDWTIGIPDKQTVEKWGSYRVRFENPDDLAKLAKMLGVYWPDWLK